MKKKLILIIYTFVFLFIAVPVYAVDNQEHIEVAYKIEYDENGGINGPNDTIITNIDGSFVITDNIPEKKGYTFIGWTIQKQNYDKLYLVGDTIILENDTILYAQWEKNIYTIKYELNGGTQNTKNPLKYSITSKSFSFYAPTRKGYTFRGWYTADTKIKITGINKGSVGNLDVFASWRANTYSIKYYGNGATGGSTTSQTGLNYGTYYNLRSNGYTKKGYTFTGWNTESDGSGTTYTNIQKIRNLTSTNGKIIKLYAQWKNNKIICTMEKDSI